MKRRFEEIEENIANLLDQDLLEDIYTFREKRLSHIEQIIGEMYEALSESEGSDSKTLRKTIANAIRRLYEFSGVEEYRTIPSVIVSDIMALKEEVPKRKIISQAPERFRILPDDYLYVKGGKVIKQMLRSSGKTEWMQNIPFQEVLAYYLLDADWFFKDWISAEERLRMQIVLELDEVLEDSAESNLKHGLAVELLQVLKVIRNHIDEAQRLHKQKLKEARKEFISQFITTFAKIGTFEKWAGYYSPKRISRKKEETQQELDGYLQKWQTANTQLLERTDTLHRFLVFCDGLEQVTKIFEADIKDAFERIFFNPYERMKAKIEEILRQAEPVDHNLFSSLMENEQQLLELTATELIAPLQECIANKEIQRQIDLYSEQLLERAGELDEIVNFITNIDHDFDPPGIKSKKIRWQSLVSSNLKKMLLSEITPEGQNIERFKYEQLGEAQEIQEILEVNLESALELAQNPMPEENPREIVDEAMQRAAAKLAHCIEEVQKKQERLLEPLHDAPEKFKRKMFDLLADADSNKLQMFDSRFKVSEKTEGFSSNINSGWDRFRSHSAVMARYTGMKARSFYRKTGVSLGLKTDEIKESEKVDITSYLSDTERRISELPYIYRRLFDFKAKPDIRYHVGLNEHVSYMQEAYNHWKKGLSTTLAITGEKGSGKSTYLELARSELFSSREIININLEKSIWTTGDLLALFNETLDATCASIDELVAFLQKKQQRRVIIFEGIQNLYMRYLNGYEAIEQLIYLIAETNDDIFWMISCSRYAWTYLDKTFNLGDYFSHLVQTDTLSESQIKKMILARHRASGYELVFDASDKDVNNRSYKKLQDYEKRQVHLREQYFSKLAKLSEGNASIAMIFWIRSIRKFDDTHCSIAPLEAASLEMLEELTPKTLFVLTALVLHDCLTPEELARTQNMTLHESHSVLKRLKARGIVNLSDHSFTLNHLIYRQVIEELKSRNILHL